MELLPIVLKAVEGNWRSFTLRKNIKAFAPLKAKILMRDKNCCQYCGFSSDKYMEVINKDGNYSNNEPGNMATICPFCAQCFFLESIGLDGQSDGRIAYLPEISQADLNNFARVLFCSLERESPYKGRLQAVYLSFIERCKEVETCFGPGTSQAATFGQGLIDGFLKEDQLNHPVMDGLRLIPTRRPFKEHIDYWKIKIFAALPL